MTEHKVDFFFVGYPKSGSTTLYNMLKSHPEIFSSETKELNYFNSDHIREFMRRLGPDYFQLARSDVDYASFFRGPPGKLVGDFNPIYIFSKEAPRNIHEYNPSAKILISVREPVSFLRSFHFQSLFQLIEDEPNFLDALALEEGRRAGHNIPHYCHHPFYLYYSSLVSYRQQIERYVGSFGAQNIKIILFDDLVADERGSFRDVLTFLNVSDRSFVPPPPDRNPSHALRLAPLRRFLYAPPIKKWLYTQTPRRLMPLGVKISHRIFKKPQDKPFVSVEDIKLLKTRFMPQVIELQEYLASQSLLKRDLLNMWGYVG